MRNKKSKYGTGMEDDHHKLLAGSAGPHVQYMGHG